MTDHDFLSDIVAQIAPNLGIVAGDRVPLPTDRWIARSALQKAVRRGEAALAEQAALTLAEFDPRSAWRALTIIALEDVGVGGFDAVAETVALARSAVTRRKLGGDHLLVRYIARRLAEAAHCQAACDLLMRAQHDPAWKAYRTNIADAGPARQLDLLRSGEAPVMQRAIALLTFLGGDHGASRSRVEAALVASAGQGLLGQLSDAAWAVSRNEMALLLPLVAHEWSGDPGGKTHVDDPTPPVSFLGGVPTYALDQFTRVGKAAIRRLVARDAPLRSILTRTSASEAEWPRLVGDTLFVVEGGCTRNRCVWQTADALRLPLRPLPGIFDLGDSVDRVVERVRVVLPALDAIRAQLSPPTSQR